MRFDLDQTLPLAYRDPPAHRSRTRGDGQGAIAQSLRRAVNYRLPGASGIVGFISPVSEPYCGTCNRLRLTADGKLHLCLLNDDELDIRKAIRSGASTAQIGEILVRAVTLKPTGHHLLAGRSTQDRSMYQIGG
jgi:cyclic pyranopterin phosphate synthase